MLSRSNPLATTSISSINKTTGYKMKPEEIKVWYAQWCKGTKRNGGILIGSSIQELLQAFVIVTPPTSTTRANGREDL